MRRIGRTKQLAAGHMPARRGRSRRKRASWAIGSALVLASVASITPIMQNGSSAAPVGADFTLDANDLRFILTQIQTAEAHAGGADLCVQVEGDPTLCGPGSLIPEPRLPFGLRTVDGSYNHLLPGQENFGASDQAFARMTTPVFRQAENGTSYEDTTDGLVIDSQPRTITNLIVDQTISNPAAEEASEGCPQNDDAAPGLETCEILNVAPDAGLSAPFNSMFTFFGQFFDHGLDLANKGGGTVFVPLQPDDPLFVPGSPTNFMLLSRSSGDFSGPDGELGTDDDRRDAINQTTPFVDQNQTYTSHPSHQVFLREYELDANGENPTPTGRLIDGAIEGNIGNWDEVKAQAASHLGIALADTDVFNVPLLDTDEYGHLNTGPNGLPMMVSKGPDGIEDTGDEELVEGNLTTPISTANAVSSHHEFLNDIAHHAAPGAIALQECPPGTPAGDKEPDDDEIAGPDDGDCTTYDDELLGAHFVTGDGRGNENIALTAVHSIFHSEHNRLAENIDALIDPNGVPENGQPGGILTQAEVDAWHDPAGWGYGERLFQAARFVTEMQYQHLVFEEFARTLVPSINIFQGDGINFQSDTNPAITAEFAHQVYRLGHSMLTESIERTWDDGDQESISLFDGFLNPLEFNDKQDGTTVSAAEAAGAIFQGGSRQRGMEIDEFIVDVLRNQLLGLPARPRCAQHRPWPQ